MDRIAFSKSIGVDQELQIKDHFDQIMAIYNLFGECEDISIQGTVSGECISFNISLSCDEDALKLSNGIDEVYTRIYGVLFKIHATVNGNNVTVHLEEEPID